MRLIAATRLSRLGDASTGLEKQDEASNRYAEAFDHEIIATVPDADVSGDTRPFDRPMLGPWLTDPGLIAKYDGIIAAHLDRLGRNVRHLTELHDWAERNNKRLITVEPNIDWSSDVGKLIWGIMAWLAEQELKAITRRSRETQELLKRYGYLVGKAPWGFLAISVPGSGRTGRPEDDHKTLIPDPDLKPVIVEVVDRVIDGESLTSVCRFLNDQGVKTPSGKGIWFPQNLSMALRNESLSGRRMGCKYPQKCKNLGGRHPNCQKVTVMKHPSIITPKRFRELQAKLDANSARKGAPSEPAPLAGVIFCGTCTSVMHQRRTYRTQKISGKRVYYYYYRCDGTSHKASTCKNMIPRAEIESWIDKYFTEHLGNSIERGERIVIPGKNYEEEINQVERDIHELDLDDPEFLTKLEALRAERSRLQALPIEPDRIEMRPTGESVGNYWQRLDAQERRDFMLDSQMKIFATRNSFELFVDDVLAATYSP